MITVTWFLIGFVSGSPVIERMYSWQECRNVIAIMSEKVANKPVLNCYSIVTVEQFPLPNADENAPR